MRKMHVQGLVLEEGTDFYFDDRGRVVFTEHYHLRRGYCCKPRKLNKCLHCPWKKTPAIHH